jgi:hypothetical protein
MREQRGESGGEQEPSLGGERHLVDGPLSQQRDVRREGNHMQ